MAVQPIKPSQVIKKKKDSIPDYVIESFNELIAKHFNGSSSTIRQDEVLSLILSKMPRYSRQNVFDNNWLDVEDIFRKAGWQVNYYKPAYNGSSYPATFEFEPKRKN